MGVIVVNYPVAAVVVVVDLKTHRVRSRRRFEKSTCDTTYATQYVTHACMRPMFAEDLLLFT
jgi:hypothetical protein